ncbi:hypothetical protein LTR94_027007, partial [Friedmanniomyces endolithicus]
MKIHISVLAALLSATSAAHASEPGRETAISSAALGVASSLLQDQARESDDAALQLLISDYEAYLKSVDPFSAAMEGDVSAMSRVPNLTRAFELAQRASLQAFQERLSLIDPGALSEAQAINHGFLVYSLTRSLEGLDYDAGRLAFDSEGGPGTWALYVGGATRLNNVAQ